MYKTARRHGEKAKYLVISFPAHLRLKFLFRCKISIKLHYSPISRTIRVFISSFGFQNFICFFPSAYYFTKERL